MGNILQSEARANKEPFETLRQGLKGPPSRADDGAKRWLLHQLEENLLVE